MYIYSSNGFDAPFLSDMVDVGTETGRPSVGSLPEYACIKCAEVKPAGSFYKQSLQRSFYICKHCSNRLAIDACKRDVARRLTQRLRSRRTPLHVEAVRKLLQEYGAISETNRLAVERDDVDIKRRRTNEPLDAEGNAIVVPRTETSKRQQRGSVGRAVRRDGSDGQAGRFR